MNIGILRTVIKCKWVTTQRDYMAGIVSTDIARNFIFPKNIIEAHDSGLIHIHDMDYMAQNTLHNCCLINLDDMLPKWHGCKWCNY